MNSTTIRYKYKLPILNAISIVVLVLLITIGLACSALYGWLPKSVNLLWGLAGISALLSLFVVWFAVRGSAIGHVELGALAAIVPKASLAMPLITVPYASIKQVNLVNLKGQQMAVISSSVGESRVNSKWFPTLADFNQFLQILQQRRAVNNTKLDARTETLVHAIRERRKEDPLVGAKIGAQEVYHRIFNALKDSKGVHIESLLCILGSLAGYSCQASVRAQAIEKGMPEDSPFVIVGSDTEKYFFGDSLNAPLAEANYSVWGLAAAAAQQGGCKELPDVHEIFKYVTGTVCTEHFGIIRVPEGHKPSDRPVEYVKSLWPSLLPSIKLICPEPENWPILFGLAIQQAIDAGKTTIDPGLALQIVMESAIPMSKVDLNAQYAANG